jgi:hypothetical protein
MFERVREAFRTTRRRLRRLERRELGEFRRWVENTDNLLHLSVLLLVPLLIGLVTIGSNVLSGLSFLLFPPLASGTYTLFSDPEGRYADPVTFVFGLSLGGFCGWAALEVALSMYGRPSSQLLVHPESAALAIFLTGALSWALNLEQPSAFSTALLILFVQQAGATPSEFMVSVVLSSTVVAVFFSLWRDRFYEERARFLYQSTRGDDHVLVPMRGPTADTTALFAARLAAAHDAGKVVLLDVVSDQRRAAAEEAILESDEDVTLASGVDSIDAEGASESGDGAGDGSVDGDRDGDGGGGGGDESARDRPSRAAQQAAAELETRAANIQTRIGVPCEVVVATGDPVSATLATARETNCDLVAAPFERDEDGVLAEFPRAILGGPVDTVVFRSATDREQWKRIMVPIARPGDSAHAMIDFAERLAGDAGHVSVCTCIDEEGDRRRAETRLSNLVETARGNVETRVARSEIVEFLQANATAYDLVIVGSSRDRSAASRFFSRPTFERLSDLECDFAIVDRGDPHGVAGSAD